MGYRLHWLNKYENTWIPLCSEHAVDRVAGEVSAVLSAQVQEDPRFNPLSPAKCHEKLKSCENPHCTALPLFAAAVLAHIHSKSCCRTCLFLNLDDTLRYEPQVTVTRPTFSILRSMYRIVV